jgi:hypothetical protein
VAVAIAAATAFAACGGGGGTTGASASPPSATALDFTVVPMVASQTTVTFTWKGTNATSYQVEIGSRAGASDVATIEASDSPATWSGVPVGTFYVRVRGRQGASVGAASNEVTVASVDARQVIEALVFGTGPLAVAGNAAGPQLPDTMEGWPPGTVFQVKIGQSLFSGFAALVEQTAAQIGPATRGAVQAIVAGRFPDPQPDPARGEVTVGMLAPDAILTQCLCQSCVGCAWTWLVGPTITRSRILLSDSAQPSAAAHELGHAIGLAHIIVPSGMRPAFAMGFTTDGRYAARGQTETLDPATVRVLETLYGAGLTAGATRRQFEAAGFVPSAAAASARRPDARGPGFVLRQEGEETVVVRPLCEPPP